jgi:mannan endo-1,4-beta-mannosidase
MRRLLAFILIIASILPLLASCAASSDNGIKKYSVAVVQKESGEQAYLDISQLTSKSRLAGFGKVYEAEAAVLKNLEITGGRIGKGPSKFSGTGYAGNFDNTDDKPSELVFTVNADSAGSYELIFLSASPYGDKLNKVSINGQTKGDVLKTAGKNEFLPCVVYAELNKGQNGITVSESWGWIFIDCMIVRKAKSPETSIYTVKAELINKNATGSAKRLMAFLADNYGKYTLSGQYGSGVDSPEFTAIYAQTQKYPAIMGLDMIDYSPSRVEHGAVGRDTDHAVEWAAKGGIVTFCWHWNAPEDLVETNENPWYKGFYKEATTFDFKKALNRNDPQGYKLMLRDIDAIAVQLKKLQDKDVPVLWRPLHEAGGGWFWWGTKGPQPYIELWKLMVDRLVNYHHLNNLIWVWNGQEKDWYPGDEYVDIIGEDIYADKRNYDSQRERFENAVAYTGEKKIITLSEAGVVPDPDKMYSDRICWSWFATWNREFVIDVNSRKYSEEYTEKALLKKVYNHEKILTLDELPDLKTYPISH